MSGGGTLSQKTLLAFVILCIVFFVGIDYAVHKNSHKFSGGASIRGSDHGEVALEVGGVLTDAAKEAFVVSSAELLVSLRAKEKAIDRTLEILAIQAKTGTQALPPASTEAPPPPTYAGPVDAKFVVATIATKNDLFVLRNVVGSMHKNAQRTTIAVYGIGLTPAQKAEARLWKWVDLVDLHEHFVTSEREKTEEHDHQHEVEHWRPIVIRHAAEKFGSVLYFDVDMIAAKGLTQIQEKIRDEGHFLVQHNGSEDECAANVQGFLYNSEGYQRLIVQAASCVSRNCGIAESDVHYDEESIKIGDLEPRCQALTDVVVKQKADDWGPQCSLVFRDDFLHSTYQLPWASKDSHHKHDGKKRIRIGIGLPTTTAGYEVSSPDGLPLFQEFLPSFLQTMEKDDKYEYVIYLGYDQDDKYYDNAENLKSVRDYFEKKVSEAGAIVELEAVRHSSSYGWVTFLWNSLFQHSMDDGCEYFYQLNDDVRLTSTGWTKSLIEALETSPLRKNFGIAGPDDVMNKKTMTQVFVHRTHYNIFGFLFPTAFRNWYVDDWATQIYRPFKTVFRIPSVQIHNTNSKGTRYKVCATEGEIQLDRELRAGQAVIQKWLDANK